MFHEQCDLDGQQDDYQSSCAETERRAANCVNVHAPQEPASERVLQAGEEVETAPKLAVNARALSAALGERRSPGAHTTNYYLGCDHAHETKKVPWPLGIAHTIVLDSGDSFAPLPPKSHRFSTSKETAQTVLRNTTPRDVALDKLIGVNERVCTGTDATAPRVDARDRDHSRSVVRCNRGRRHTVAHDT